MFIRSFYAHRSQKRKTADDLTVILVLLGSTNIKALLKMLMKSTPYIKKEKYAHIRKLYSPSSLNFLFPAIFLSLDFHLRFYFSLSFFRPK
jgi:hypothetical protein